VEFLKEAALTKSMQAFCDGVRLSKVPFAQGTYQELIQFSDRDWDILPILTHIDELKLRTLLFAKGQNLPFPSSLRPE
jgi:hypothetical protein